jgi:hypothetical protein
MGHKETPLMKKCLLKIGRLPGIRIFRNNVGMGYQGKAEFFKNPIRVLITNFRMIKFGLLVGSGDYIGWKSVVVTPEMVGKKVAVFLSVEIKSEDGKRSEEQENWSAIVRYSGGIAVFIDDLENIKI